MSRPLLLDISCLCEEHTDAALEFMAKAIGEDPPGETLWDAHPNPFVRRIVELFTERGLDRIAGLNEELRRWLAGGMHSPNVAGALAVRPAGAMRRWDRTELAVTRLYLENLPPEQFTLDDWMLVVEYLVQRYLPDSDLRTDAEWLATRSQLMGRVQAALGVIAEVEADTILARLPAIDGWAMTIEQRAGIEFGSARCCESVTALADGVRHRMRKLIVGYQEAVALGNRAEASESLQSKLLDEFGMMNRDWRRIAVTEATENVNQGFVAAAGPGARIKRVEKYRGACAFCRNIDGKVVTVVDAAKVGKDGDTEVWVGKTNVGRSASPRKRSGGELVARDTGELWWIAAGSQHPNCRGAWVRPAEAASADPEFDRWLAEMDRTRGKS